VFLTFSGLPSTNAGNTNKTANEVFYFGEDGSLECSVFTAKVAWNFYSNVDNAEEKEISYGTRLVDNSGYSITSEGRNLTVFNVSAHDAGKYLCDSVDVPEQNRRRFIVTLQQRSNNTFLCLYKLHKQRCELFPFLFFVCEVYLLGLLKV